MRPSLRLQKKKIELGLLKCITLFQNASTLQKNHFLRIQTIWKRPSDDIHRGYVPIFLVMNKSYRMTTEKYQNE